MAEPTDFVEEYLRALGDRDVDSALGFYADDAVIVSFRGVAEGREQLRSFLVGFLAAYDGYQLVSVDQLRAANDVVVWDATIETGGGMLQVTNVVTQNTEGKIVRHVPLVRGYWGKN